MWGRGALFNDFKKLFEEKNFNCIAPDLPGHSKNKKTNIEDYGFTDFVNYIADIIKNLDERPIVTGHSMGGLIAHKIAEMGLCEKAVLITPVTQRGFLNVNKNSIMGFMPVLFRPFFWSKPINPTRALFKYICMELSEKILENIYTQLVPESGKAFFEISLWAMDLKKSTLIDNKKINCPVLQIAGDKDKIISPHVLKKQARLISKSIDDFTFKRYSEYGHGIIWDKGWEKLAQDIIDWIQKE